MTTVECVKKTGVINEKFSTKKLLKFVKVVKPILKLVSKKQRTNAITPSTCNYDIIETVQNDLNENEMFNLQFKFLDSESEENAKNEELERKLMEDVEKNSQKSLGIQKIIDDEVIVQPVPHGTYFAIPVHFVETCPGQFSWAPITDVDICRREDENITNGQIAERQTAVLAN